MHADEPSSVLLYDRRSWRAHRDRSARSGSADFLHDEIADRLVDRIDMVGREFPVMLDLGARNGALARMLAARPGADRVFSAEPSLSLLGQALPARVAAD